VSEQTTPPAYIESLCALMHKYGLSKLCDGVVELERPQFTIAPPETAEDKDTAEQPDELERVLAMSTDAQDRELMLTPLGRAG
jgi:hypothetical protein